MLHAVTKETPGTVEIVSAVSGCEPPGVPREHGCEPDVGQAAEEHDDSLQADPRATVGGGAVLEGIDVGLDAVDGDAVLLGALC